MLQYKVLLYFRLKSITFEEILIGLLECKTFLRVYYITKYYCTVSQAVAGGESEDGHCTLQAEGGAMEKAADTPPEAAPLSSGGVLPRTSKESTPGASSSKEGTHLHCRFTRTVDLTCMSPIHVLTAAFLLFYFILFSLYRLPINIPVPSVFRHEFLYPELAVCSCRIIDHHSVVPIQQ